MGKLILLASKARRGARRSPMAGTWRAAAWRGSPPRLLSAGARSHPGRSASGPAGRRTSTRPHYIQHPLHHVDRFLADVCVVCFPNLSFEL